MDESPTTGADVCLGSFLSVDALPYLGPRLPWLAAGDEMFDRSVLVERLRPLGLWWVATEVVGTGIAAGAGRKVGMHR
jgi:hypothetical protein